jgi:hypothetical protein
MPTARQATKAAGPVGEMKAAAADQPLPQAERHALQGDRDQRAADQRAARGEQRRVGRVGAFAEHQRGDSAADERPDREAEQGQHPDDQPLPVPPGAEGERE